MPANRSGSTSKAKYIQRPPLPLQKEEEDLDGEVEKIDGRTQTEGQVRFSALTNITKAYRNRDEVKAALRKRVSSKRRVINDHDDTLGAYLKTAATYDLLDGQEETELFRSIDEGIKLYNTLDTLDNLTHGQDQTLLEATIAHQVVLLSNLRLAVNQSKPFWNDAIPRSDIVQEANLGLMRAIALFDYQKGFKFSTYASQWIQQGARRTLGNDSRTIRIPIHRHDLYLRTAEVVKRLTAASTTGELSREEIEQATKMSYDAYTELMRQGRGFLDSLDAPLSSEPDSTLFGELIPDNVISVEEAAVRSERKRILEKRLQSAPLNAKQKFILGLRSGLEPSYFPNLTITVDGGELSYAEACRFMPTTDGLTLNEIGDLMHLTRERVRQIESKALIILKQGMRPYGEEERQARVYGE